MGGVPLENRNEVGERGMGNLYNIMAKAQQTETLKHLTGVIMMTGNSNSTHPAA